MKIISLEFYNMDGKLNKMFFNCYYYLLLLYHHIKTL
jgi:hypothetical protein